MGATVAATRHGCGWGESFEGYETRCEDADIACPTAHRPAMASVGCRHHPMDEAKRSEPQDRHRDATSPRILRWKRRKVPRKRGNRRRKPAGPCKTVRSERDPEVGTSGPKRRQQCRRGSGRRGRGRWRGKKVRNGAHRSGSNVGGGERHRDESQERGSEITDQGIGTRTLKRSEAHEGRSLPNAAMRAIRRR